MKKSLVIILLPGLLFGQTNTGLIFPALAGYASDAAANAACTGGTCSLAKMYRRTSDNSVRIVCSAAGTFVPVSACSMFEPSAASTTPRSVYAVLNDMPRYPEDYGACGDGTCDDTAELQAWLDSACSPGFSKVALSLGCGKQYKITQHLTCLGSNGKQVSITGDCGHSYNDSSTILWAGDSASPALYLIGVNGGVFQDFAITPAGGSSMKTGIWIDSTNPLTSPVTSNIASISRSSNVVSVETTGAHGLNGVGFPVTIAGVTPTSFNGTAFLTVTVADTTHFTYRDVGPDESGSGGTALEVDSPGSSGVLLERVKIGPVTGSGSVVVQAGRASIGGGTVQVSEVRLVEAILYGESKSTAETCFKSVGGGNVANHHFLGGEYTHCATLLDLSGLSGASSVVGATFAGSTTDIIPSSGNLSIVGVESECTDCRFISGPAASANPVTVNVKGVSWNSGAPAADDCVIHSNAALVLEGNHFFNRRTAGAVAKVCNGGANFAATNTFGAIDSRVNYYQNASGFAPFYGLDGTTSITGFAGLRWRVTSRNDLGGDSGSLPSLTPFDGASIIMSTMPTSIGTTDVDGTPATGWLIVQGENNDGSKNIFVGRDSDAVNAIAFDTNGILDTYNSQTTVGVGQPYLLGNVSTTGLTAAVGSTNLVASAAAGTYRATAYIHTTTAAAGVCTSDVTIGWTYNGGAKTKQIVVDHDQAIDEGSTSGSWLFRSDAANITYAVSLDAGGDCTSAAYAVSVVAERVQ